MKKYIMAAMAALTISLSPVYATSANAQDAAPKCVGTQSKVEVANQLENLGGNTMKQIPQNLVSVMVARLGPPPGNDGTVENLELFRVDLDDQSAIFIFQKGCMIYRMGPASHENVDHFLERLTDAT